MADGLYLSIRVFSHDRDTPFRTPSGTTFEETTLEFANTANALVVFERCAKPLRAAQDSGLDTMTERQRPGPTPRTQLERAADAAQTAPAGPTTPTPPAPVQTIDPQRLDGGPRRYRAPEPQRTVGFADVEE